MWPKQAKRKDQREESTSKVSDSNSKITIYKAAVQKVNTAVQNMANVVNQVNDWQKRFSSSFRGIQFKR